MTTPQATDSRDERILVLAPLRQDGPAVARLVGRGGLEPVLCSDLRMLVAELAAGAGAVLIAEETVAQRAELALLRSALEAQPTWSEIPVLLVVRSNSRAVRPNFRFGNYINFVLLERPLRSATLVSALRSALGARRRQYQIRDYLIERARHEEELQRLNETLEERVAERTRELEEAMSSRAQAEQALRQAQKAEAIGQLTGGIAHDFNNLLMVFTGGLTLLERETHSKEHRQGIIRGMRHAADRGQALTRQLLAFARKMTLAPEPINLRSLIEGMRILVGGALRGDIVVEIDIAPDVWPLMADRTQLELALLNLAVNARDAMPKGGVLSIEAHNSQLRDGNGGLSGEFVTITVRDTGIGIPPAILDRVFDPFFTTKPVDKGTGLGLSQVYGFARQSGGTAVIHSEEDRGTSVILNLPRARILPRSERAERPQEPAGQIAHGNKTVLLVEDNHDVAQVAEDMLVDLGFKVVRVENARQALSKLEVGVTIDLVFSDIVMPGGMNGLELAREVKRRQQDLPVLLTSGYSDAVQKIDALEGFCLLQKPYQITALEEALRRVTAVPSA